MKRNAAFLLLIFFVMLSGCVVHSANNGMLLYEQGKYVDALPLLMVRAERGDALAQERVGLIYAYHLSIPDPNQAVYWLKRSALKDNAWAQHDIGILYLTGRFVPYSPQSAVFWLEKSARQGNVSAQAALSAAYTDGYEEFPAANRWAIYWLDMAARQGDWLSQYTLAVDYFQGFRVEQDYRKALYWFEKSTENGDGRPYYALGVMYRDGKGVTRNCTQAKKYFEQSIVLGGVGCSSESKEFYCE